MKIIIKIILGASLIVFLGICAYVLLITNIFSENNMCGNRILETKLSPNNLYKLVLFERNCGATSDFSVELSILKIDDALENEHGNIFSADSNHGMAKINENGIIDLETKWINDSTLIIEYDKNARVFFIEKSIDNFEIKYIKL